LYQQAPISITVEGANILTRSLMIFGQGAIRSHPYVLKEIAATLEADHERALHLFDDALFGHVGFFLSNTARSFVFGLTGGRGIPVPAGVVCRRYYQQLTRFSSAFALTADVAMAVLGGSLKRRERLTARLGDVLSQLYLCSATLKRFADDGRPASDLPLVHWVIQDALYQIQLAFAGIIQNFPNRVVRGLLSALIFPLGKRLLPPSDRLAHEVAELLMQPGEVRDRLTAGIYISARESDPVAALEAALESALACEPLQDRLALARRAGKLLAQDELLQIAEARKVGLITAAQALELERDYALRCRVIRVDDFSVEQLRAGGNDLNHAYETVMNHVMDNDPHAS
jgi:acyl-CoA dehydrogenase